MIKVYYATVPTYAFTLQIDNPLAINLLPVTHRFVCDLDMPDRESVFGRMQGEVWSPNGEACELIASLGVHHTSMTVGDVVQDHDGVYWMCADLGWERLPDALTPGQWDRLLVALDGEIRHLCEERGVPFTNTDLSIGERLIAWRNAVASTARDGQ